MNDTKAKENASLKLELQKKKPDVSDENRVDGIKA